MNRTKNIFFAVGLAGLASLASCNSDDVYETDPLDFSGVAVKGFSLKADKDVLNNLDSVFFSIDLVSAQIYNADSLPYGTKTDKLMVEITSDAVSEMHLIFQGEDGEQEIDYIGSSNAEIDFSRGPVRLHLVSGDGQNTRDYTIKVNVHNMVPDSLYWASVNRAQIPGSLSAPAVQRSVRFADKAYCLTASSSADYCMAVSDNLYDNVWTSSPVSFGEAVNVRSLSATSSSLYILTASGRLLVSADGMSWSDTGEVWTSITAPYADRLLGVKTVGTRYVHAEYPASSADDTELEDGFPLSGNAGAIVVDSKWSATSQVLTVGGRDKNGALTGDTWAFDGSAWACIGSRLPAGEGYAVAQYTVCETDTVTWRVKESSVLLAIGGRKADGVSRDVYISRDLGLNWSKAFEELLLPEYIPALYDADMLVFDTMLPHESSATARGWMEMPVKTPLALQSVPLSRAVAPITSWECPFLYLIGGIKADGSLQPYMWRGAVNHFRFRPLQ